MLDRNVPKPWQGQTTLVFALTAVAVGLGNTFRLPWLLGEHGGAPFFLVYVATLLLVVAPVLAAEVMLGSNGRGSPLASVRWASDQSGRSVFWSWLGPWQAILALLLGGQLLMLAAWMVDRADIIHSGTLAAASTRDVANNFETMLADVARNQALWLLLLAGATVLSMAGPQYAMFVIGWLALPALLVTALGLVDFSVERGDLTAAGEWLFAVRYRDFGFDTVMAAIVSALYTLGAGLGVGLVFGTRAPKKLPLLRAVTAAVVLDCAFAIMVAVIITPLLFATNTLPVSGIPLVFVAVPHAYVNLPMGEVYGALFFGFLSIASLAALVALMEPTVMLLRRDVGLSRWLAAPMTALALLSVVEVSFRGTDSVATGLAGLVDLLIPVTLLAVAYFVGWRMPRPIVRGELFREPRWLFSVWWESLRLVTPVTLLLAIWWVLRSPVVAS